MCSSYWPSDGALCCCFGGGWGRWFPCSRAGCPVILFIDLHFGFSTHWKFSYSTSANWLLVTQALTSRSRSLGSPLPNSCSTFIGPYCLTRSIAHLGDFSKYFSAITWPWYQVSARDCGNLFLWMCTACYHKFSLPSKFSNPCSLWGYLSSPINSLQNHNSW